MILQSFGFDQDIPEKTKKNIKNFSFLSFFVGVFLIFGYEVFVCYSWSIQWGVK